MLKDSGFIPPEVTLMREIAALRRSLAGDAAAEDEGRQRRLRLAELEQQLALRLESLGAGGRR